MTSTPSVTVPPPIFADRATLEVILASGTRAVQSYPLRDDRSSTLDDLFQGISGRTRSVTA